VEIPVALVKLGKLLESSVDLRLVSPAVYPVDEWLPSLGGVLLVVKRAFCQVVDAATQEILETVNVPGERVIVRVRFGKQDKEPTTYLRSFHMIKFVVLKAPLGPNLADKLGSCMSMYFKRNACARTLRPSYH